MSEQKRTLAQDLEVYQSLGPEIELIGSKLANLKAVRGSLGEAIAKQIKSNHVESVIHASRVYRVEEGRLIESTSMIAEQVPGVQPKKAGV